MPKDEFPVSIPFSGWVKFSTKCCDKNLDGSDIGLDLLCKLITMNLHVKILIVKLTLIPGSICGLATTQLLLEMKTSVEHVPAASYLVYIDNGASLSYNEALIGYIRLPILHSSVFKGLFTIHFVWDHQFYNVTS